MHPWGFPRQEHWSGLLFPSLGDLPDPGTESESLAWGFSPEARRGSQGASRGAPGKSGLHGRGEGERVLALESREGTRASRRAYGSYSSSSLLPAS